MNEFEENMDAAKVRVMEMDRLDGFRDRSIQTALFALEAGLRNPESGAQFDALVMLSDIVKEQRA